MFDSFRERLRWLAVALATALLALPLAGAAPSPGGGSPEAARSTSRGSDNGWEPQSMVIVFEDDHAPCRFPDTTALGDRYSRLGVLFSGPAEGDGGAILGDCSNFGVGGYRGYGFLAFNRAARLAGGGIPQGPETLRFLGPVRDVQILAGSPAKGSVTLTCFDRDGAETGSASLTLTPTLQPLSVPGAGIRECRIEFDATALVLDNLQYTLEGPLSIPSLGATGLALLVLLIGLAGAALLRRV